MDVTVLHPPLCPPARAVATPIPPARTLRIRLNHACLSRPDATAAAMKQDQMGSSHNEEPAAKRHSGAADEKGNKNAPAAAKIGNLLRPCSRGDEAPRSPLGGKTKRRNGGAAVGHTGAPPAAKRKATTPDSGKSKRRASSSRVPIATKKQQVGGDGAASSSPSPRSSDSEGTVRALLTRARPASDAIRRRDIERLRAQARLELDQMVRTVEFNDPFITPQDVLR
ncbi:hypothetical protein C2845_PM11G04530 [Panicum miliaceum]|uniref:Uncharacterized protein n=1 Tax=Panicum miliaceum TaxID=4540 RepID=A0A3L6RT93_PANMI|nr:hypothetical protein C2845_PM11G04530 [Panicum miliaceum]